MDPLLLLAMVCVALAIPLKSRNPPKSCIVNRCGSITLVLSKVMFDCEGHWLLPNIEVATWYNDRLAILEESYCCQQHCGAPKS
jgi:hypothetical protein